MRKILNSRNRRRWGGIILFTIGALAALYFFWTTSHLVMAFQEQKTAHVFSTEVSAVGWDQPDNALSQDLSYLAPAGAFTTQNSAYLQLAASTSTSIQGQGQNLTPAPPSGAAASASSAPSAPNVPATTSTPEAPASPVTPPDSAASASSQQASTTASDGAAETGASSPLPTLPLPDIVVPAATDTSATSDDSASTSATTDQETTDDSAANTAAVSALQAAALQLQDATGSDFTAPANSSSTAEGSRSDEPALLDSSSTDDSDTATTTSMIRRFLPVLASGMRRAEAVLLSKLVTFAYATSTSPVADPSTSTLPTSSTTSTPATITSPSAPEASSTSGADSQSGSSGGAPDDVHDVPDCSVLGTACHTIEFSGFNVDGSLTDKPLKGVELNISLASIAAASAQGGKLAVRYYNQGQWHSAGDIYLDTPLSNQSNGGYFTETLPDVNSWDDVNAMKVVVEYDPGDGSAPVDIYIDSVWVDAIYTDQIQDVLSGNVANPTDAPSNVTFGLSSGDQPDNTLVLDDWSQITFPYLDSLQDTLAIRSDKPTYEVSGTSTVMYASITNTGKATDEFHLSASFPGGVGQLDGVSEYLLDVPNATTTSQYSDVTYFCAAGWSASASSSGMTGQASSTGEYSCPASGEQYACSSLDSTGSDCLVPDVVIASATSTNYESAWVSMPLANPAPADSKVAAALPPGYEEASATENPIEILPGQTLYFKVTLDTPDTQSMRFVLSASGQDYFGSLNSLRLENETYLETEAAAKKAVTRDNINEQLSEQSDFGVDQLPSFQFRFKTQRSFFTQVFDALTGKPDKYNVQSAQLEHQSGEIEHLPVDIEYGANNQWTIQLQREGRDFRPGKYSLNLSMNEGGSTYNDSVSFYWGVLALNPNKSSYEPGDTAHLSIAALDDSGNTMCDAQLALTVTDPSGVSSDVPVVAGGGCGDNNVTTLPDFIADYQMGTQAGTYTLTLSRLDDSGDIVTSITDTIEVQKGAPYVVTRSGPTRIYPVSAYTMSLGVSAPGGFNGNVVETVPEGFTIVDAGGATQSRGDGVIYLTWGVSLASADVKYLTYTFKAPDVSPYIYLLGPATMSDESGVVFTEPRTWKIASDALSIATGVAWLGSSETTNGTNLNSTTPYPLVWNVSDDYDPAFYSYSTSSNPSQLGIQQAGDYLVAVTVPVFRSDATGDRTEIEDDVRVDGGKVDAGVGRAFIRTNSTVKESSAHLYVLLRNLNPGDYIESYVHQLGTATDVETIDSQASMYAEYIGTDQSVYFAVGTTTEAGTNLNPAATSTMVWYDDPILGRDDANYTHSETTNADTITLGSAGSYMVFVNIPVDGAVTSASPGGTVTLNGVLVPGGEMEQGYIANSTGVRDSSLQWSGVVTATTTDEGLKVGLIANGAAGTLTVLNDQASIYIQALPTSGVYLGEGTTTTSGTNWNPATQANVKWTTDAIIDSGAYSHSTSSNPDIITVSQPGDYLMALDDSHVGAVNSSNEITQITVASSSVSGALTRSHFIPNTASGDQSSGSLVYLLRNLAASSTISVTTVEEARGGTITEDTPATFMLWHKSAQSNYVQDTEWWYENTNAQTPSTPWAGSLNPGDAITNGVAVLSGDILRIRMALTANVNTLAGADSFKLQYAPGSICSLALAWSDIGAPGSGSIWRGYNNTSVTPGSTLTTLLIPTSSTTETYEDQNPSAVTPNGVAANTDGEWDWSIEDNGASLGTSYCFRMVESTGEILDGYNDYPSLITNAAPDVPTLSSPFDDALATSTLPDFRFSSSDNNSDDINYEIQVSTDPGFGSIVIDDNSLTNYSKFSDLANPSDKAPFKSGQSIQYVPTTALTNGTTYWWRARAIDPNGSDTYSSYSAPQSFTVRTSATVTTWYQTTPAQFSEDTLFQTATTSGSGVQLAGANTSGTITSPPIDFSDANGANAWGDFTWSNATSTGTIIYQVEYLTSTSSWALIPNSDLPGNSAGTSTSPIVLTSLDPATYSTIEVVATLAKVTGTPSLTSWTVSWELVNAQPILIEPFDDSEFATSTPSFTFFSTSPTAENLTYQVQWSTSASFSSGNTTVTSDAQPTGFSDTSSSTASAPYPSGDTIQYTIQAANALASSTTYWWEVRAENPSLPSTYSQWSIPQSFTVNQDVVASTWYQTTSDQFNEDDLVRTGTVIGGVSATSTTGDIAVYREAAAGNADALTTSLYNNGWDTTVYQSSIFLLSGTTTVVLPKGHYAVMYDDMFSATAGTYRAEIQSALNLGGEDLSAGWSQGIIRHNTGTNEAWTSGGAIIDVPVNSESLILQSFRTDTDTATNVARVGGTSGLELIKLDDAWSYIRLSRQSKQTGPNSTNLIDVAYDRIDEQDAGAFGFTHGSSDITLVNPGYYLVFANTYGAITTNSETDVDQEITLNGYPIPGTFTSVYMRGNANGDGDYQGAAAIGTIIYATTTNEILNVKLRRSIGTATWTIDANQLGAYVDRTGLTIAALPSADIAILGETTNDNMNPAAATAISWNTNTELATSSFSHSISTNATRVTVNQAANYLFLGDLYAASGTAANIEYNQTWRENGSAAFGYGGTGGYKSTAAGDVGNWSAAIFPNLSSTNYLEMMSVAAGSTTTAAPATQKGLQALNIGTLPTSDTNPKTIESPPIIFSSGTGPKWSTFSWDATVPTSTSLSMQILYYNAASSTYVLVPDSVLPGNAEGFSTTTSVNISNLDHVTYGSLETLGTFTCFSASCPTLNDWTVNWSPGINISGTAKAFDQVTNLTSGTVAIAVNSTLQAGKTATISGSGTWSIPDVTAFDGDVITAFISGATGTARAVAVTKYETSGDITGMELYQMHLTLGDGVDDPPIADSDINLYDNGVGGTPIFDNVDAGDNLAVCSSTPCYNARLLIMPGTTFEPAAAGGVTVTTPNIQIDGTFQPDGNTIDISHSWKDDATFIPGASTVVFTATSTAETVNSIAATTSAAFNNVTFGSGASSAVWALSNTLSASGTVAVNDGTLSQGTSTISLGGSLSIGASGIFSKGTATTSFTGSGSGNTWTDNSAGQDMGTVAIAGSAETLTLGSNVKATNITIAAGNTLDASTGNYGITVLGNWTNNNVFTARSGTVTFAATSTGFTIAPGSSSFYNITFNGTGGNWSFSTSTVTANNNFTVTAGTVTLATGTTTVGGSFDGSGGTFLHNNGTVFFNGSGTDTIHAGASSFYNLAFNGSGSWSFVDTNATTSNNLIITAGALTMPSGTLTIGGSFGNAGTFTHNSGTLKFTATSAKTVSLGGSNAFNLFFAGTGGSWTMLDTNDTALGSVTFQAGTTTFPSATFSVGGSFTNSGGAFSPNGGTVSFIATATGNTIAPGASTFSGILFNSSSGGWTVSGNATSTNNTTITAASSFTMATGTSLAVLSTFTNSVGGSATNFTNSTLFLDSGTSYSLNLKGNTGDTYGTLMVGPSTNIKMWNSSAATTTVNSTGSLYSQNHAGVPGALDIWGAYSNSGSENWASATDFDGTPLSGASARQVSVKIASSSVITLSGIVNITGTSTATTTVANQGTGTYAMNISGGTTSAQYYQFANLGTSGLNISGSPTITSPSLGNGLFTLAASGTAMTVAASVINANPALQIFDVGFATSTGVSAGTNVTEVGTPTSSYWWFRSSYGSIQGENFDNDPGPNGGNPGYIRWDNSGFNLTISGHVYSDHGITPLGAPTCNGSSAVVTLVVNGGSTFSGSCNASTGAYSIPNVTFTGDVTLTAYLNTNGGARAVTVTKTPTANVTNLDLYQNSLIVREEGVTSASIADLAAFDSGKDSDVFFSASTSTNTVVLQPNTELYVWPSMTFAPGGTMTLQGGGSGDARDGRLYLATSSVLTLAGSPSDSIGGGLFVGSSATFTAASSTITFTATTTGKVISSMSPVSLNTVVFNGTGGGWSLGNAAGVATTTVNSLAMTAGTLSGTGDIIVSSGGLTGSGTIAMTGGMFLLDGTGSFGDGNPWQFANLTFGNGTLTASSTNISTATTTVSGILTISTNDTLNAGTSAWLLSSGGMPFAENGTFDVDAAPFWYTATAATTVTVPTSASYANLFLTPSAAGSPTYTLQSGILTTNNLTIGDGTHPVTVDGNANDPSTAIAGSLLIASSSTFSASNIGALDVAGSWTDHGTFTHNNDTVLFDSGTTGNTVNAGNSPFYIVQFNSGSGGWTVAQNATSSADASILAASSFTLSPNISLAVLGTFTNSVGGAATTFASSTLFLDSGTSYSLNTKANTGETYGTLMIGPSTNIRMWNSSAATTTVSTTGSLYSQNHAGVAGALDIWGAYTGNPTGDYWDYATDFDGTTLGSPRQVNVFVASSSSLTFSSGLLDVVGTASATTTIQNQGTGAYSFAVSGGTLNAQYYKLRNTDQNGLNLSSAPTISGLSNGDFQLAASGTMITVAASVINANPLAVFHGDTFATSTSVGFGANVTEVGNPSSSWKFTAGGGNYYGEKYDDDPGGDPGYIVWDDSNGKITVSGNVYSDEGTTVSSACNGSTQNVKLVVEGATSYTTSCAAGTGAYSISGVSYNPGSPGDTFTLYLIGSSGKRAADVTVNPNTQTDIINFNLYENRVIVRDEGSAPLTIASMSLFDSHEDSNIPFTTATTSTTTLTIAPNTKLIVWTGKSFAPGGNVTILSGGQASTTAYDGTMEIQPNATFFASGTQTDSIGGNLLFDSGASLVSASSTFVFTATTTGKSITPPSGSSFYNMTFNGTGGNWAFSGSATTTNNFTITNGTVTLPSGALAVGGSFANSGTFMHNNGTVTLTSTASGNSISASTSPFYNLTVNGTGGSWSFVGATATTSNNFTIAAGAVTLPSANLIVGGSFVNSGTFTSGVDTVNMTANTTGQSVQAGGSSFYLLKFNGVGGAWSFLDSNATVSSDFTIATGTVTLPSGTLSVGGSFTDSGAFNNATGTVALVATTTGKSITPGNSPFYNLTFNSSSGGWTIAGNATSTNNTTITAASSFTLATSTSLAVLGTFTNSIGGAPTTWTNSTLFLDSGTSYSLNVKGNAGDNYGTLMIGPSTNIRMWGSSAATTTVNSTGSLYSMNHAGTSGALYIWGAYTNSSTEDYWDDATDFDGSAPTGGPRQVNVFIASSSVVTYSGTSDLDMVGTGSATTTVQNQGTGAYTFAISGGSSSKLNASYYQIRNTDSNGLNLSGTPTISGLSNGDFQLGINGGTLITVNSTVINANPSQTWTNDRFATSTGITSGYNVTFAGTATLNAWTFTQAGGNYFGEAYDNDGATACGNIRWDNSSCLFVSEAHYEWRNDDGGEGALASQWYNASWTERQQVVVSNPNATSYTNYPLKLVIPYASAMQSGFGDLRFTDSSGTSSIPYFIESTNPSVSATVWVSIPSLPASGSATLYMYYGNGSATTTSSGASTFPFYEDFETNSLSAYSGTDKTLFTTGTSIVHTGTYGLYASSGNTGQETSNGGIYRTATLLSTGETIQYYQYVDATPGSGLGQDEPCTLFGVQAAKSNYGVCLEEYPSAHVSLSKNVASNDSALTASVLATSTVTYTTGWYQVVIDWLTSHLINVNVYNSAGSLFTNLSYTDNSSPYSSGGMGFTFWEQHGGWDYYTARPYAATIPTYLFGTQQGDNGATWKAAQDTALTGSNGASIGQNIRLRFSVQNTGPALFGEQLQLQAAPLGSSLNCESVTSGYVAVPAAAFCGTSAICMASSTQFTNYASTSPSLSYPASMAFAPGEILQDPSNETGSSTIPNNAATEVEYNFLFTGNATGHAYCLRTTNNGTALNNYSHVAEATVLHTPTVGGISLNGGQNITLVEGTTTTVLATTTVTDDDGYADMVSGTSTIYRSGVSGGANCNSSLANCYQVPASQCTFSSCSGNQCLMTCSANLEYFADSAGTATSTYTSQTWMATMSVVDSTNLYGSATISGGVGLWPLLALEVSSPSINFGTTTPGNNTGSTNATTTVFNTGNMPIDVGVAGNPLLSGLNSIAVNQQKYATSTFTYASCALCQVLSGAATPVGVDIPQTNSTSTQNTGNIYFGLNVPTGSGTGSYSGTNTFIASAPG